MYQSMQKNISTDLKFAEMLPEPLEAPAESEVIHMLHTDRDKEAGEILIRHNLRLVVFLSRRYEGADESAEDLMSVGTIGLIKAVRSYDPQKKIKLSTYASRCIENEIRMHLRKKRRQKNEVSIEEPVAGKDRENSLKLSDVLGTDKDVVSRGIERKTEFQILKKALERLSPREQRMISLRFGFKNSGDKEKTQQEVADFMGLSQSYVSRMEKRVLRMLKSEITSAI